LNSTRLRYNFVSSSNDEFHIQFLDFLLNQVEEVVAPPLLDNFIMLNNKGTVMTTFPTENTFNIEDVKFVKDIKTVQQELENLIEALSKSPNQGYEKIRKNIKKEYTSGEKLSCQHSVNLP